MPKREDIQKIMIIGSGPIIIGQACEFDYSGTQACKALAKLGYEIVLVNSNPATIMTDPKMAGTTYIEPLNLKRLTEIIEIERPDALLPNLGGQTALNLSSELAKAGVLDQYHVEVIGVQLEAIERGEDRIAFKETMAKLGIEMPKSTPAYSISEAEEIAAELGYPCVVRPAYTMGGTGGGIAYNVEELRNIVMRGLAASMIHQVLIEESVIGWEELELEVVRDSKNQMITVCFIENIDPMGVHTGDSFCSAPMLNVKEEVQRRLQAYSYAIVESIEVIGGCNCQFAYNAKDDRIVVIEINPRTSRSSALASKATGFPIAYVSSLLAAGLTLDEIPYWRCGTLEKYTPYGDYVVVKFARWAFEKFKGAQDLLGTQMKAVGEVMSIGKTYKEALQKAIRSLEIGQYGLGFKKDLNMLSQDALIAKLSDPSSERQFILYEALRKGVTVETLSGLTRIKPFFLKQMQELVMLEEEILSYRGQKLPDDILRKAKQDGFSDRYIAAKLLMVPEDEIRKQRIAIGVVEQWEEIMVSGVEKASYYYSTYNVIGSGKAGESADENVDENVDDAAADNSDLAVSDNCEKPAPQVMILGGGPNRIGQGIEFDYCCVHVAFSLRNMGFRTIMVNCNPETVSTDYDTADKLYFEPLTTEEVYSIYMKEKPVGVIVQFGGQTPLNLANDLERLGVPILGTTPDVIDLAEDRDRFRHMMEKMNIPMPESGMASNYEEAKVIANQIGYPVMVRPSYVLGGRGMEVVHDDEQLASYVEAAIQISVERPILIDRFLGDAIEAEADAVSDGENVFVPAIMQHIELAGIHSGDSACVIPPISIKKEHRKCIYDYTERIARELGVVGLMNMQYAIEGDVVYVLEANPRASRTVPLVSKVCNIPIVDIATRFIMNPISGMHESAKDLKRPELHYYGVKEAVFPFNMFHEVDPILGPEMRSTGEVLGLADSFGMAFYKSQEGTQTVLPTSGNVFLSIADGDKKQLEDIARKFSALGFGLIGTRNTQAFLENLDIPCRFVNKLHEGRPNVIDIMKNGEVDLVVNTPGGKVSQDAGVYIRRESIRRRIPCMTTMAAAEACAAGIDAFIKSMEFNKGGVKSLQLYHEELKK